MGRGSSRTRRSPARTGTLRFPRRSPPMLTLAIQEGQTTTTTETTSQATDWTDTARELVVTYGPRVLAAIVILIAGWIIARFITSLAGRGMGRANFDKTLARFLTNLTFMLLMT